MESFRALKLSKPENFRALKFSFRVLDFRVRKFSNLESIRALESIKDWKKQSEHNFKGLVLFIYNHAVHGCRLDHFWAD